MSIEIKSPLTNKECIKISNIDKEVIIKKYLSFYNIDIRSFFETIDSLSLYKCKESGYYFFAPFVYANSYFYEKLQNNDWYYMPWKWEHEIAFNLIEENSKVLEVGSAKGDFIRSLAENKNCICVGLEFNKKAFEESNSSKFKVFNSSIEEFAKTNKNAFDVVCSFQVLEHVSDVKSFLAAKVECLKKGGKLIISVPDNNSFISLDNNNILNFPPHHVGRWNRNSLLYLEKLLPLKTYKIFHEPIQDYHKKWYNETLNNHLKYITNHHFILSRIYWRLPLLLKNMICQLLLSILKMTYKNGHSITIIFKKIDD